MSRDLRGPWLLSSAEVQVDQATQLGKAASIAAKGHTWRGRAVHKRAGLLKRRRGLGQPAVALPQV